MQAAVDATSSSAKLYPQLVNHGGGPAPPRKIRINPHPQPRDPTPRFARGGGGVAGPRFARPPAQQCQQGMCCPGAGRGGRWGRRGGDDWPMARGAARSRALKKRCARGLVKGGKVRGWARTRPGRRAYWGQLPRRAERGVVQSWRHARGTDWATGGEGVGAGSCNARRSRNWRTPSRSPKGLPRGGSGSPTRLLTSGTGSRAAACHEVVCRLFLWNLSGHRRDYAGHRRRLRRKAGDREAARA